VTVDRQHIKRTPSHPPARSEDRTEDILGQILSGASAWFFRMVVIFGNVVISDNMEPQLVGDKGWRSITPLQFALNGRLKRGEFIVIQVAKLSKELFHRSISWSQ